MEEAVTIPWHSLLVQTYNCGLLFLMLYLLIRKPMRAHFAQRAESYRELVDRAESARREAENNHTAIKSRLNELEASASRNVQRAQAEAIELRTRLNQEARDLSAKLEREAQRMVINEGEKAKMELRRELLGQALGAARNDMEKNLTTKAQKKLQNEFVEKIEMVNQ
jgi:F0F1-type ATP synthase membrane subunit b/b'